MIAAMFPDPTAIDRQVLPFEQAVQLLAHRVDKILSMRRTRRFRASTVSQLEAILIREVFDYLLVRGEGADEAELAILDGILRRLRK